MGDQKHSLQGVYGVPFVEPPEQNDPPKQKHSLLPYEQVEAVKHELAVLLVTEGNALVRRTPEGVVEVVSLSDLHVIGRVEKDRST